MNTPLPTLTFEAPHIGGTYIKTEPAWAYFPMASKFYCSNILQARFVYIGDEIRFTDGDASAAIAVLAVIQKEMMRNIQTPNS